MERRIKLKSFDNLRLNLGCGDEKKEGFIGMDEREKGQEIVWNVLNGIPLPDESCSEVYASHFMEHFDQREIIEIMNETWRVLKKDGILDIVSPDISSSTAYLPQHKQQLTINYFSFFTTPNVLTYRIKQWEILQKEVVHRNGDKYDLVVKMKPVK